MTYGSNDRGTGRVAFRRTPTALFPKTMACGFFTIALLIAPAAWAQVEIPQEQPYRIDVRPRIKVGAYFLTEGGRNGRAGEARWLIEPEVNLSGGLFRHSYFNQLRAGVGIPLQTNRDTSIGFATVSQIHRNDDGIQSHVGTYFGYGIGLYSVKIDQPDTSRRLRNLFGGLVSAGVETHDHGFLELRYHIVSHYENRNVNGFQVSAGFFY